MLKDRVVLSLLCHQCQRDLPSGRVFFSSKLWDSDYCHFCDLCTLIFTCASLQVIFSDEKRFAVINDGPVRVWRRRTDRFRQGFVRNCVKHSRSVMMWLAIDSSGRSRLTRCAHRQDSAAYQTQVLQPNLAFIRAGVFQQDGASSHTSASTQAYLATKGVSVLPDWPAHSPDLNPVEHCWAWLAKQLVGQSFRSEDELEAAIRAAWASKPPTLLPKLFGSMVRRLTAVIVARGASTRY
jgi:transposase